MLLFVIVNAKQRVAVKLTVHVLQKLFTKEPVLLSITFIDFTFSIPHANLSTFKAGKWNPLHVSKDDRSDIESSSDEDNGPPPTPVQKHHNSTTNGTNKVHGTNGYLSAGAPCLDEH
ncbi:unnamed protein product [Oncorhynchus mykiss]|uniref:Uncharacterized protein n=1 Tax=Oncorhynchus mykiss TaxID=8022 RepID=A0A060VQU9_ONCMY|nr:unnamed protein product [Oncorhynchus mykiss]